MFLKRSSLLSDVTHLLRWTALALPVAVLAGTATALFLWSLEAVTKLHWQHPWLLWLLRKSNTKS